jgi:hypothetical protein
MALQGLTQPSVAPPHCCRCYPRRPRCTSCSQSLESAGHGHLVERLTRNVGFGMGLEFRESHNVLGPKNTGKLKAGQVRRRGRPCLPPPMGRARSPATPPACLDRAAVP